MKLFSFASIALLQVSGALAQEWGDPSGAISWGGLGHIRVYAIDAFGNIGEWQYDGNGWTGPSHIGTGARIGTTVTAVHDENHLRVYYKHNSGAIRERVFENGWGDGATLP